MKKFIVICLFAFIPVSAQTYLSDLDWDSTKGINLMNNGEVFKDEYKVTIGPEDNPVSFIAPICVAGVTYAKGIVICPWWHVNAEVVYHLKGQYGGFIADVGITAYDDAGNCSFDSTTAASEWGCIDDSGNFMGGPYADTYYLQPNHGCWTNDQVNEKNNMRVGMGAALVNFYGDGRLLGTTDYIYEWRPGKHIDIDLTGINEFRIVVSPDQLELKETPYRGSWNNSRFPDEGVLVKGCMWGDDAAVCATLGAPSAQTFCLSEYAIAMTHQTGPQNPASRDVSVYPVADFTFNGAAVQSNAGWLNGAAVQTADGPAIRNTFDISGMAAGTHEATVSVEAGGIARSYKISLTLVEPLDIDGLHVKVNAGVIAAADTNWTVDGWEAEDAYASGGYRGIWTGAPVDMSLADAGMDPKVYRTMHYGEPTFNFFAIPNGEYLLRLHFADMWTEAGVTETARRMVVTAEGETILSDFDPAAEAGGGCKALVKEFTINVADGNGMTLAFDMADGNDAFVNAIEIIRTGSISTLVACRIAARDERLVRAGHEVELRFAREEPYAVSIHGFNGRVVRSMRGVGRSVRLIGGDDAAGVYFIRTSPAGKVSVRKLIVR